jgi:hypothetical protein
MMKTEGETDPKAFVTLRFAGDDLDPGEITRVLAIAPTRAHRKDEIYFAGKRAGLLRSRTEFGFSPPTSSFRATTSRSIWRSWNGCCIRSRATIAGLPNCVLCWSARTPGRTSLFLAQRLGRTGTRNPRRLQIRHRILGRRHRNRFRERK